jgi:hypothetical protein
MNVEEIRRQLRSDELRDRAHGRPAPTNPWTKGEIVKLARQAELRKQAWDRVRQELARDQQNLDAMSDAKQMPVLDQRGTQ